MWIICPVRAAHASSSDSESIVEKGAGFFQTFSELFVLPKVWLRFVRVQESDNLLGEAPINDFLHSYSVYGSVKTSCVYIHGHSDRYTSDCASGRGTARKACALCGVPDGASSR